LFKSISSRSVLYTTTESGMPAVGSGMLPCTVNPGRFFSSRVPALRLPVAGAVS
jgi:hypothetical protein